MVRVRFFYLVLCLVLCVSAAASQRRVVVYPFPPLPTDGIVYDYLLPQKRDAFVELAISRNLGPSGPSEAIHANTYQNPYLAKNPEALQGRVLQLIVNGQKLHDEIVQKSKTLEQKIKQKIFGQDEAVRETANAIVRYAAGLNDTNSPIASLLYCGPSGVGKTELAKQLCLELYGKQSHFIRINMSEYVEPHSITRLIGPPPGYIGYHEGGVLANRLLQNPFSVVLLDEVEKAHPKVLKLFMHVFDAGYLTSSSGQDVDCRNAVFILTSNIASSEIAELFAAGLTHAEILESLEPYLMDVLSPEMYNRLDCMVFAPLSDKIFEKLVRKILDELKIRILKSKGIDVLFDDSLVNYLKVYTIDPKLGARPLKRIVEKELTTTIAHAILDSDCKTGDTVFCSYVEGHICLEVVLSSID